MDDTFEEMIVKRLEELENKMNEWGEMIIQLQDIILDHVKPRKDAPPKAFIWKGDR